MRNYYKCMQYAYPNLTSESNKPTYVYLHNEITVPEEIIDFNPRPKQTEPVSEPSPTQPTTLRRLIPSQTSQDAPELTQVPVEVIKTYQVYGHYTQACTVRATSPEEALELSEEVDDWDYLADPEFEVREVNIG